MHNHEESAVTIGELADGKGQLQDQEVNDACTNGDVHAPSNGHANGQAHVHENGSKALTNGGFHSVLSRFDNSQVHDLVCVGFGPASLAIAVALHDALIEGSLVTSKPKVRFLERQPQFQWHAGMLIPGAKMQISFIKDMATLRNPRSHFTFLNYLHEKDRLVSFTNLGTFLPLRREYEDYMRWCAEPFGEVVDYDRQVQSVTAGETDAESGVIKNFRVISSDSWGKTYTLYASHIVIAAGGKPNIPKGIPTNHPRIIHSSQYVTNIDSLFAPENHPKTIAVVGAGQSAAEVFQDLPHRFPDSKSVLIIRGASLRPSDDSPFVNEIFNPEHVDEIFSQDADLRNEELVRDRGTNYSVVRLELLEEIYNTLYSFRIQYPDEKNWPQRIFPRREVVGCCDIDGAVELTLRDRSGRKADERLKADLVVVASGYVRDSHVDLLADLSHVMPKGGWKVKRDYSVDFVPDTVDEKSNIWLQGCNEQTHGLSDTLLSILAVRAGEVVGSIFG
ncbi:L-ornithine 5-monooxygenase [Piedraia hortae CBS 480.64]|uniref:L-ornithine N(5)-monooxygenase [NAD(P)H] n=1 Tax=Piedraia hortae CBS 480.64 TaxID=1314780 RepID=A0A6A7BYY0_9PEZI|nr:L-ornithine 5-monooxygenase [Piedraia hortae CBS 480.64]